MVMDTGVSYQKAALRVAFVPIDTAFPLSYFTIFSGTYRDPIILLKMIV